MWEWNLLRNEHLPFEFKLIGLIPIWFWIFQSIRFDLTVRHSQLSVGFCQHADRHTRLTENAQNDDFSNNLRPRSGNAFVFPF